MKVNMDKLQEAIRLIENGVADKISLENVTVYRVKNIIRVDIKEDK